MTLIQELLDDLAPEGVKYVRLAEIAEVGTGSSNRNESSFSGQYPLFVRSKTIYRSDDFEFDEVAIVIPGEGGIGEIFHYVDGKYALHQRAYRIRIRDNSVDTKFVLYFMKSHFKKFILMKAVSATVTSIRKPMILDFRIPVPPLQVQQRIVEILDTFTSLEADLEAELEARKKQYEFYRNQLLTFPEQGGVRWVPMGDVLAYKQPGPFLVKSTEYSDSYPTPVLTAGQTFVLGYTNEPEGIYEASPTVPTIIFDDFTTANKWVDFHFKAKSSAMKMLVSKDQSLNLRFAYFYLQMLNFQPKEHARHWIGTFAKLLIPLPGMTEQLNIVESLNNFDALTNGETIGLPAELKARRKQYEYYRDKLLTFRELEA